MLQIGINGLHIKWGVNAGTETYLTNIIKPWYESRIRDLCFTLYCNQLPPWWIGEKAFFKAELHPLAATLPGRLFLEQIVLPLAAYRKLDLLFCPGYVGSIMFRKLQIITIHDGFAWRYPLEIGRMRGLYWRTAIPLSAKRAARLIAVSQSTADDVANFCQIPSSKISVILEAGEHLKEIVPNKDIFQELGISHKAYFHCVGIFKEVKNPWRLFEAYKEYIDTCSLTERKQLVLVGRCEGKRAKEILLAARDIPNVIIAGRIDDHQLAAIYEGSAGLIFPSLYEGFGIPILEAQSFDCPVITSNNSSMPEVGGEGVILVNPYCINSICRALHAISNGAAQALVEKGRNNLTRFSWKITSDQTLELIRDVASGEGIV